MNKKIKTTLYISGAFIIVVLLFFVGYMYKMKSETGIMTPSESKEILPGIYALKDSFANLYLIRAGNKYIAIDAANDPETVKTEMKKFGINPEDVIALLLTHTDSDHTGALELFWNAKVYLSSLEEQMINGKTSRFFIIHNKIKCDKYNLLNEYQAIDINGIKVQLVLTPGHTPGSACYIINDRMIFTGDALSLNGGKAGKFNEFFNMDGETTLKSISKIAGLQNIEYIFTAHYGYSDNFSYVFAE